MSAGEPTEISLLGTSEVGPGEPPAAHGRAASLRRNLGIANYSLVLLWAIIILIFGILTPSTFLTWVSVRSIASEQAITAMMALALVLPLAAGIYDLSIGGTMGLSAVLVAWFQLHGLGAWYAIASTVAICGLVGACNAFVITKLHVNSFIATLGSSSVLLAALEWVSGGQNIVGGLSNGFLWLGSAQLLSFTFPVFFMLGLAVLLWYVLKYRQSGRYMYAIGSNREAARLAGVRADRLVTASLIVSALIAGCAGILFTATIGSAQLDAGSPYLLPAFAAAFLGSTQFGRGRFNVPGTILAVYVLATGVKGLELMGSAFWVSDLFNGAALIIAVAFAVRRLEIRL
jgi:ribose transport system permease protein